MGRMTPDEEEERNEPEIAATYTPPEPPLGQDSIIDLSSQRFSPPPPVSEPEPETPAPEGPRPPVFAARHEEPPPEPEHHPVFASVPREQEPPPRPSTRAYE